MTEPMRNTASALISLTLTTILVLTIVTYQAGSTVARTGFIQTAAPAEVTSVQADQDEPAIEGAERIDDDSVPLAAPVGEQPKEVKSGVPTFAILGVGIGAIVTFFLFHIRRINASISDMNRKLR